jgi:hypothetical protein
MEYYRAEPDLQLMPFLRTEVVNSIELVPIYMLSAREWMKAMDNFKGMHI